MMTYSSKSNAVRAARAAGLDPRAINFSSDATGRWSLVVAAAIVETVEPEPTPVPAPAPRAGSKASILLGLAGSEEGVTNARLREVSGWTKLGGFFDAAKRAGVVLHRCREADDTRWFAVQPGASVAYLQDDDGQWRRFGRFSDPDKAAAFACSEAPRGTTVAAEVGRNGEIYLRAAGDR